MNAGLPPGFCGSAATNASELCHRIESLGCGRLFGAQADRDQLLPLGGFVTIRNDLRRLFSMGYGDFYSFWCID
jgi:hypothetical protein